MKTLLITLLFFIMIPLSEAQVNCGPNLMRVWTQSRGYSCMPRMIANQQDPLMCLPGQPNPFVNFPGPLYQPQVMPWWAYQGNLHYPNLHYPGAWFYPRIQSQYYPGSGEVFAAKPNVYVESIHQMKKFNFRFVSDKKLNFLVTTPPLDRMNAWQGKIVDKDKFEVDGIYYDYLFYDIRLPKEKMQFDHGVCSTREGAIEWMLLDLKAMKFPAIALQDFEEHWRVKIPDYPFYCIYPQYNRQLSDALPVGITLDQSTFIRSLYILSPHKKEPDINDPSDIPLPTKDSTHFRPMVKILKENMFKEWGVAFLGQ
jgi:hypothetical protein